MTALSIVVATTNPGKLSEIRALVADLPVEVLAVADALPTVPTVVEDEETFEGNALKKAREISAACLCVTLADDSGLEVHALDGRPGVRSARLAREGATDGENNAVLLELLQDVDDAHRQARFRCCLALVDPWDPDHPVVMHGQCEGAIARTPSGTGGFGYDPLFIVAEAGRTMAELGEEEKNRLSHRARALQALRPKLEQLVRERLDGDVPVSVQGEPATGLRRPEGG